MAERRKSGNGGMLDLEKELTCSICTDVLFQPLTLLDCLHTFCGSCLKEWFQWQADAARSNRRNTHPYTCPSCRASVRDTKPNASVTTLLDMFMTANPGKGKTEAEKAEMRTNYTSGENVLPKVEFDGSEDSEDERILQEVRQLSLAGVDSDAARRAARRTERARRRPEAGRHTPEELGRMQRQSRWTSQQAQLSEARLRQHDAQAERQVDHQPSLVSLISASEGDSQEIQQSIMQEIVADGWFNNIDMDNMTQQQEDELTERIAQAYLRRQRQRDRSRNRSRRRDEPSPQPAPVTTEQAVRSNEDRPGSSTSLQPHSRPRPPIARPHLFENASIESPRVRSSSAHSRRSNRSTSGPGTPAAQSTTDVSQEPRAQDAERERRRRLSSNTARSTTDPENMRMLARAHRERANSANPPQTSAGASRPSSEARPEPTPVTQRTASLPTSPPPAAETTHQSVRPAPSMAAFAPELVQSPPLEPSVSCDRCAKPNLQYDLHYHCSLCLNGAFNLCLNCYRTEQGCNHWFGFGYLAFAKWERMASEQGWPPGLQPPHILLPRRYLKRPDTTAPYPEHTGLVNGTAAASRPENRLQEGAFCERCFAYCDSCYWHCSTCLDGAWGFCNACVQKGQHCTHPLTAIAHKRTMPAPSMPSDPTKLFYIPLPHLPQHSYLLIPVSTDCDVCRRFIPPTNARHHCYVCSAGDYDVCGDCYRDLEASGRISAMNGVQGWRRCPHGHRMALISFQDSSSSSSRDGGVRVPQRITARAPVGGWALKEDDSSNNLMSTNTPATNVPDGGVGMRCVAKWSYWPPQESRDELAFPRGAEITEVEDINGDWYWGVYAGAKGVFPGPFTRVL